MPEPVAEVELTVGDLRLFWLLCYIVRKGKDAKEMLGPAEFEQLEQVEKMLHDMLQEADLIPPEFEEPEH